MQQSNELFEFLLQSDPTLLSTLSSLLDDCQQAPVIDTPANLADNMFNLSRGSSPVTYDDSSPSSRSTFSLSGDSYGDASKHYHDRLDVAETTMMVRNIPQRLRQYEVLSIFESFVPLMDFVYMPSDMQSGKGLGYVFLNFISAEYADLFRKSYHMYRLDPAHCLKVSRAVVQGLEANMINVMSNAAVFRRRDNGLIPLILKDGILTPITAFMSDSMLRKPRRKTPSVPPGFEPRVV